MQSHCQIYTDHTCDYENKEPSLRSLSNKEIQTIVTLSSSIAHELNNYFATISIYTTLSENNPEVIKKAVKSASYLVQSLQLYIKEIAFGDNRNTNRHRPSSITKTIEEALENYPFSSREKKLVTIESSKDFQYIGNPILTYHILYNLIKNSLYAINKANKGNIIIKLKAGKKSNQLIFRDTAIGITRKILPDIFTVFVSHKPGGLGIGLAFCRNIMQYYGGDIICNSIENKYTEMILSFPKKVYI